MRRYCFYSVAHYPVECRVECRRSVTVKPENKARVYHYPAVVYSPDRRVVVGSAVLHLMNSADGLRRDALEADEQAPAAARFHQVKKFAVLRRIYRDCRLPPETKRHYCVQEFPCPLRVARKIVVDEHDVIGAKRLYLRYHIGYLASDVPPFGRAVVAEIAAERTSAARVDNVAVQVLSFFEHIVGGRDYFSAAQVVPAAVNGFQLPMLCVADDVEPCTLGGSDTEHIERVLRYERSRSCDVYAAGDNDAPAASELRRYFHSAGKGIDGH